MNRTHLGEPTKTEACILRIRLKCSSMDADVPQARDDYRHDESISQRSVRGVELPQAARNAVEHPSRSEFSSSLLVGSPPEHGKGGDATKCQNEFNLSNDEPNNKASRRARQPDQAPDSLRASTNKSITVTIRVKGKKDGKRRKNPFPAKIGWHSDSSCGCEYFVEEWRHIKVLVPVFEGSSLSGHWVASRARSPDVDLNPESVSRNRLIAKLVSSTVAGHSR